MDFKIIQGVVSNIIQTVQDTAVASVNALKNHTFTTTIKNLPKTQAVKGSVTVANQKNLEKELREHKKVQKSVLIWLKSFKLPKDIKVSNFPEYPKFPDFPKSIKVDNFPEPLPFPKNIRVTNQPTAEIKELGVNIKDVTNAVKKLKLNPNITVERPPEVVVPAPHVTVTQEKIDYKKLAELISKAAPSVEFDYKKLEKLINANQKELITVGGGGHGSNGFIGRDNKPGKALVDESGRVITSPDYFIADKKTSGGITHTGNENSEGDWFIMKVAGDAIRYASNNNNPSYPEYESAWTNRASLEYNYPSKVSF